VVKGLVKVKEVRTSSAAGVALLEIAAPGDNGEVLLQLGPVIKTSAVRDALRFVNFGDFTNQVDYANISREINLRVKEKIVAPLDKAALTGKTVEILGVFAHEAGSPILITPVRLTVGK
jgi:predicted lipoprotein